MNLNSLDDTICAIATAAGPGGIAIVRLSGGRAGEVAGKLLRTTGGEPLELKPRYAALAHVSNPNDPKGSTIDEVLALWMPGPNSYTREDVLEIHCHGGRAAANAIMEVVMAEGIRLAGPGEFTLRAFLRGRIDLVQAEAVADIIGAETGESLKVHEALLKGRLSTLTRDWQDELARVLMHLESYLDFDEEEDVGLPDWAELKSSLMSMSTKMREMLDTYAWGRTAREGYRIAIVGAPNVGKSSLLNRMADDDRAIVSPVAGTTRDTIEVRINALGAPVHIIDTAGLRVSGCEIEVEGVNRARQAAKSADLVLLVFDGSIKLSDEELAEATKAIEGNAHLAVINKVDKGLKSLSRIKANFGVPMQLCAKTGEGVDELLLALRERAWSGSGPKCEEALTRLRHRETVEAAHNSVVCAIDTLEKTPYVEAAANELHLARGKLGELLGDGAVDEVLERIFSEFCIGK